MTVLTEHHSADGEHSFFVMHNRAVTWGIPGNPRSPPCTSSATRRPAPSVSPARCCRCRPWRSPGSSPAAAPRRRSSCPTIWAPPRERRHPRAGEASAQ
ncbi:hypothetical protein NKH18_48410 [Streptomyces sp. M10(2022)]